MNHEESRLQQQCVAWFRAQYPQYAMLLVHPINEGSGHTSTDRRRQGIHKAEGSVSGVPDLLLFMASHWATSGTETFYCSYYGLGIEMKTKKGSQSQSQKDYQKMFEAAGYRYVVVKSLDDFRKHVDDYIGHVFPLHRKNIAAAHVDITQAAEQREREKFYKIIGKK